MKKINPQRLVGPATPLSTRTTAALLPAWKACAGTPVDESQCRRPTDASVETSRQLRQRLVCGDVPDDVI
jgi:hypothetical protein